jgi:hypothetical protein
LTAALRGVSQALCEMHTSCSNTSLKVWPVLLLPPVLTHSLAPCCPDGCARCFVQVLPVMLLGALVPGLRRLYSLQEYVSALLLVGGLILFTLADAASSPNFQVLGVAMVCTALLLDAILGNMQEAIFAVNPATSQVSRTPLLLP